MRENGKVVRSEGPYKIVEVVETYKDGTKEVIGYVLLGPGSDSTWLFSLESAIERLDSLLKDQEPTPSGPTM